MIIKGATDLVERIATDHELTKTQAREVFEAVLGAIIEATAKGDDAALSGFGRFKVSARAARQGRNPATGETIAIPASRKLAFSAEPSGLIFATNSVSHFGFGVL